jgi:[protein-PII] uridylyltransferase
MVRHHLLLPQTATRRDLDDPATAAAVAGSVGSRDGLELLHALAEADARATGPGVWDDWKATLVGQLVARVDAIFSGAPSTGNSSRPVHELPAPIVELALAVQRDGRLAVATDGTRVTVAAPNQPGLLWRSAGVLALHRLGVRSATATLVGAAAVTVFEVEPAYLGEVDAVRLREDLRRALDGSLDLAARLTRRAVTATPRPGAARAVTPPAAVLLPPGASASATVIEVRAHDRPGLLFTIARALAGEGLDVRSARVETLGAEVVDAFYVTAHGHPLDPARAGAARRAIEVALASPR